MNLPIYSRRHRLSTACEPDLLLPCCPVNNFSYRQFCGQRCNAAITFVPSVQGGPIIKAAAIQIEPHGSIRVITQVGPSNEVLHLQLDGIAYHPLMVTPESSLTSTYLSIFTC